MLNDFLISTRIYGFFDRIKLVKVKGHDYSYLSVNQLGVYIMRNDQQRPGSQSNQPNRPQDKDANRPGQSQQRPGQNQPGQQRRDEKL